MKKILKNTVEIKNAYYIWITLDQNLPKILNQNFWQKSIPVSDKIEYLRSLSRSNVSFWEIVKKVYPETENKIVTANAMEITYEDSASANTSETGIRE